MKPISDTDLEQLSAYLDGELSDSERRFFQKRLSNDAELRAYCERVWIASSVLKSQPLQIMPENSADLICSQCNDTNKHVAMSVRWVASFGAIALVAVIGFQLIKPTPEASNSIAKTSSPAVVIDEKSPVFTAQLPDAPLQTASKQSINSSNTPSPTTLPAKSSNKAIQMASQNDPAQFELNESTRSKTWPRSNQGMDDFLARHNQMIDANASNGLISYAQILTDQELSESEPSAPQQADQ